MSLNHSKYPTSIVICDDHQLFCQGLKEVVLQALPNVSFAITNTTATCLEVLKSSLVDVFICDIKIGNEDGLDFIQKQQILLRDKIVIVLSGFYENYLVQHASQLGVDYYLKKESGIEDLLPAILGNESSKLKNKLPKQLENEPVKFLSKKEKEILKLIITGMRSKEIAEKLFISKNTVDTHRRNIHRKLNTTNTAELTRIVYESPISL
jgi:DNA-binding NarL/FixJ family response regulator